MSGGRGMCGECGASRSRARAVASGWRRAGAQPWERARPARIDGAGSAGMQLNARPRLCAGGAAALVRRLLGGQRHARTQGAAATLAAGTPACVWATHPPLDYVSEGWPPATGRTSIRRGARRITGERGGRGRARPAAAATPMSVFVQVQRNQQANEGRSARRWQRAGCLCVSYARQAHVVDASIGPAPCVLDWEHAQADAANYAANDAANATSHSLTCSCTGDLRCWHRCSKT